MVTVNKFREALANEFGKSPMRIKALSQELAQHGLRTAGGSGRGAVDMTGRDAGLHTIALALDLPTKDAASEMAAIDGMALQKGQWLHDERVLWEADATAAKGTVLGLLARVQKGPSRQFPAPGVFGQFLGAWVDGVFEPELGTYHDGKAELVLHRDGPRARFLYEAGDDVIELYYSAAGFVPPVDPPWEHPLIIRGEMFRRLANVVA